MKQLGRRHFLESTMGAVVSGVAVPLSNVIAAPGPLAGKIKIAVKYQMIREEGMSVVEKFQMLKELGFDGTELSARDKVDTDEIVKAITETGLPVHGVINSSDPDIVSSVKLAKRVGGDSVLVLARLDPEQSYEKNFQHWQDLVSKAIPVAEQNRVRLCIENVRDTFLKTGEEMARFIDSFESPFVRSYYHTGNTITRSESKISCSISKRRYRRSSLLM